MSRDERRPWRHYAILAKTTLSVGLLAWLLGRAEVAQLGSVITQAYVPLLMVSFCTFFAGYVISASRWRLLLRVQGSSLGLWYLVQSFMVSVFFNNFLPSTVGGDIVRIYDTWRAGSGKANAMAAVLVDRLLGLVGLAAIACLGLAFADELTENQAALAPAAVLFLGATTMIVALIFSAPLRLVGWIRATIAALPAPLRRVGERFVDAAMLFHGQKAPLAYGLGLSLLLQGNVIVFHYLVGLALGLPLNLTDYALFVPLALVLMLLPITINGIGLRESVFALFFSYYGLGVAEALAFAWLIYGQILLQGLIGGLVYAVRRESISRRQSQLSE